MKVNDIVTVFDGSYSMSLVRGKMKSSCGLLLQGRRLRVLGVGGRYPTKETLYSGTNNTLLVDIADPDFVAFTQERFCKVVTPGPESMSTPKRVEVTFPRGASEILLVLRPAA